MFCAKVKEYLSQEHVSFVDRDITLDPSAISELQKLGFMTTPVTVIGKQVIVGFDQQKLSEALHLEGSGTDLGHRTAPVRESGE